MAPDNNKPGGGGGGVKDEAARKGSSSSSKNQEQVLKCPRCDSMNTKFCYYNNYSLTQPRHFCKTCRRYWTKGGALRNVPIGGGCRKNNKKLSSRSSSSSRDSSSNNTPSSSDHHHLVGGLRFFHGLSPPAMDFQLGGLNLPSLNNTTTPPTPISTTGVFGNHHQFSSSFGSSPSCFSLDPLSGGGSSTGVGPNLLGFNFPLVPATPLLASKQNDQNINGATAFGGGSGGVHHQEVVRGVSSGNNNLASSIESLSCINQDLHWKLQQQRFAMLFGGGGGNNNDNNQKETNYCSLAPAGAPLEHHSQIQKPQPILFQNLEISRADDDVGNSRKEAATGGNLSTEWFFENSSYASPAVDPNSNGGNNSNGNENGSSWNGVQAWGNLNQFSALP